MAVEESLPRWPFQQAHNRTVPIQHKLAPEYAWAQQERRQYARHAQSLGEQAKVAVGGARASQSMGNAAGRIQGILDEGIGQEGSYHGNVRR